MRSILLILTMSLVSAGSFADNLYGKLVVAPASITVVNQQGAQTEYLITSILNTGSIWGTSISLSNNGLMAMCGDYLGQLAQDFSITVEVAGGIQKTATVRAADGKRKVSVYGMCQGNTNTLTQLQIDVQNSEDLEVN